VAGGAAAREFVELRYRLEDGERMGRVFESPDRLRTLATRALVLGRRTDVYVGCAPRTRREGVRDAVARSFVLWADCDGHAASEALARFDSPPAIVLASGSGPNRHAFWLLANPVGRDELERANRRLAYALGADVASTHATSILRVPGTLSHKHTPPVAVRALRLEPQRRVAASEVVGALPDPPASERPRVTPAAGRARSDDPLLEIAPAVYVQRLLGVEVPRHRKVPCPFHSDQRPSLHVYDTPQRGWYCFGRCRRGGSIYDLAAALFGYDAHGADFLRLRAELLRLFCVEVDRHA
jgi:hypothetical protein